MAGVVLDPGAGQKWLVRKQVRRFACALEQPLGREHPRGSLGRSVE
jgi:hypothetical protein